MKKSLFIILMVCLALVGLVSCKNEIEPAQEELIYVSFENSASRAIVATLEGFDVGDFYWSYEAKKNDGSGLKSGQTDKWNESGVGSVAVQSGKGLNYDGTETPVKVPGFSKGYWNFRLFAYTDQERTKLAYWGETDSVLIDSNHHLASITVSPVSGATGYLKIGSITFNPASTISIPTDLVIYTDELYKHENNQWVKDETQPVDGVYTLPAGQYKYTRTYSFDGIPVANGSVIVTVYSNLTTTVSGSLSELTTYAEFEALQNPDIVRETWGTTEDVVTTTTGTVTLAKRASSTTEKVTSASMPATAAVAKLNELSTAVGADDNTSSSLKLNLSVDTTDVKQQSVTYDIGMEAVLTYTKNSQETSATSDVKNVADYVLIDIDLTSDISGVTVTHSGEAMIETDDMTRAGKQGETDPKYVDVNKGTTDDPLWVGFYKLETTTNGKVLHIKTKSFSPFEVTYEMKNYVAAIGNVKYTTLTAAIAAAKAGDTIIILDNITTDDGYLVEQNLNINTQGYTITVNNGSNVNYRAFKVTSGKLSVYGGGTIVAVGAGTTKDNGTGCYGAFTVEAAGELVVSNMTLQNSRPWGLNVKVCGGKAELTKVTINSSYGGGIEVTEEDLGTYSQIGRATLTDCTFKQTGYFDHCSTTLSVSGGSKLIVNSGSYTSDNYALYVFSSGGVITVKDGTFSGNKNGVAIVAAIDTNTYPQYTGGLAISGGTFTGGYSITSPAYMSLTGGKYSVDPRAYVAEGYGALYDQTEEAWIVSAYNVNDVTANVKYFLATKGEYKGLLIDGDGKLVPTNTYKDHELQLLDSSLSNVVADEIDNFNAGLSWTAIHPAGETENTKDFAGGYGTKIEPYWIEKTSQMQAISDYYDADYAYYKVRTAGKIFDASDWTAVNINGSFNGNGAVFQALDMQLFRSVGKAPSDDVYKIKNLTVNADIRINGYGAALIRQAGNNLTLEDITVHGYIEGNNGAASFVCFGPGNITTASPYNRERMDWKFVRCISDATINATGDMAVGFIKHPYSYASQQGGSAEAQASCLITIEDSLFKGTLYYAGNSAYAYKYFVGNANDVLVKTSYSDEFIALYGDPEGQYYGTPDAKVDGKFFIGNYPGEGKKISGYGDYGTVVDRYMGAHYKTDVTPGVLPEKYAAFSVQKTTGAVSAKAVLEIAPNGPDGKGAYLGTFMVEDIEVLSTQETIETTVVKYFDIDVNAEGVTEQGLSPDGKTYHVYNPASYGDTYSSAGVRVLQYAANGEVLSITYFAFQKSN